MWSQSRPGLRRSWAIWECPDWRPSGLVSLGKSGTWTRTAGFGPVQTGSQLVWDRTSPTLGWDICTPLHSGLARKYHMPSERMGWDISTPLHSGLAGKYHMPLERMGWEICITVSTTLSQFGLGLGISKWHSFPFWVPELQNGTEVPLSNFFGTQIYFQHLSPPN